jgi:hypothetical protein
VQFAEPSGAGEAGQMRWTPRQVPGEKRFAHLCQSAPRGRLRRRWSCVVGPQPTTAH